MESVTETRESKPENDDTCDKAKSMAKGGAWNLSSEWGVSDGHMCGNLQRVSRE